jgi:organic hydroperoxide reductase OsmC/OhrA
MTMTSSILWERGDQIFFDGKYSRGNTVRFDGGISFAGSSAPSVVRPPLSRVDAVDPEELLLASLSMCHMLTFLDFARKAGFVVDRYEDDAEGTMGKDDRGKIAVTKVVLKPVITWSGDVQPTADDISDLHHKSHEACFIASSYRGEVRIEGA